MTMLFIALDHTTVEYSGWYSLLAKDVSMDDVHCWIQVSKDDQVCYMYWINLHIVDQDMMDKGKGSVRVVMLVDDAAHWLLG